MTLNNPNLNLKKRFMLDLHSEVSSLCKIFLQKYRYHILNFIRIYHDGSVAYLCDNYDWLKHYFNNGYPSIGAFEKNTALRKNEFVLWDSLSDIDPIVVYSRELFNIRYGITLIRRFNKGYDFFNFGTTDNSLSIHNIILTQLDELNKFINIFYDKTKHLLNSAEKKSIQLTDFFVKSAPHTSAEKIYLGPNYNYNHLTKKEISYLKSLIEGMTIPEIAQISHISPRTIEKHLENIKQKLGCKTQCELGYLIAKTGIIKT